MLLVFLHRLCSIWLILAGLVPYSKGTHSGCDDWTISERDSQDVCCTKCKPGNRLVKRCGKDPALLCKPCDPNKYTTNPKSDFCLLCTQCTGPQFTLKPCNITSDTVCGCKAGYRCGDEKCSYCITECREGEEPTEFRSCRKCPPETFNDKIHSMCRKWKESCPNGQILVTKGNAFRDHECIFDNEIRPITDKNTKSSDYERNPPDNTLPVMTNKPKDKINWIPLGIGGVAVLGILCIISVTACVKARRKTVKPKTATSDQELSEDSRIIVVEQEACSFRHPEQEQGSSSESISTQDSESKLIV